MLQNKIIYSPDYVKPSSRGLSFVQRKTGFFNFPKMEEEKKCTKCGDPKPLSEFGKDKRKKDGLQSACKTCYNQRLKNYHHTKEGLISVIYASQKQHSPTRGHQLPTYSKKELLNFALQSPDFNKLFDNWVESGFDKMKVPSFDRGNDYKGYSFDNFNKWMPWEENANKGCEDRKNGINNKDSKSIIGTHKVTGKILPFHSAREAQRQLGVAQGNISACCTGNRKSAGGYYWKFKN